MINCQICETHKASSIFLAETPFWVLREAPAEKNLLGYYYIELKLHIESWLELGLEECQDFGNILYKAFELSLTLSLAPEKVYFAAIAESVPHLHVHMVPRYKNQGKGIAHLETALGTGFSKPL